MFNPATFNLNARVAELYPAQPTPPPMADPPEVAAARAAVKAQQERAAQPNYAISGQMYAQNAIDLPDSLKTGDRKIDNLTLTGLAQGVPYDQLAKNAGIALDYASRPMSEGGGKEPDPGLLDFLLPAAMGLGVGAVAGPLTGAIAGGLFGQQTAPLPLVGAGLAAVGQGAMSALGSAKDALTTGNGFTNTNLGLTGENLALPGLSNAPNYVPPTAGVGPGALGYVDSLGQALTNIPGLNLTNAPAITQPPAYTLGGLNPATLYNPQSLGGPAPSTNTSSLGAVSDVLGAAAQLSAAGSETPVGTPSGGVAGGIVGNYQSTTPYRQVNPFRRVVNGANPFLSGSLRG